MSLWDNIHGSYVLSRRVQVLSRHLADLLPTASQVLDVGCGDGRIARLIMEHRPDLTLTGIDVLVRPDAQVPVRAFDGEKIPQANGSCDVVMFVDVLHHTLDPMVLLREALRVARRSVLIKDHHLNGWLAGPTLRFMDRVGNARHGVSLPYNYWESARWTRAFAELGLRAAESRTKLGLYPPPASWLFERSLHFISRLEKTARVATPQAGRDLPHRHPWPVSGHPRPS